MMPPFLAGVWVGMGSTFCVAFLFVLMAIGFACRKLDEARERGVRAGEDRAHLMISDDIAQLTAERDRALAEVGHLRAKLNRPAKEDPFDF